MNSGCAKVLLRQGFAAQNACDAAPAAGRQRGCIFFVNETQEKSLEP
jgi:hypothetical protein